MQDMREPVYNQRFDDIYFSPEDGLAETRHVFLRGNKLPQGWQDQKRFTIVETGFGTGLNFLACRQAYDESPGRCERLDFISFEKYPLAPSAIAKALSGWRDIFGHRLDDLCAHYPLRIPAFHRLDFGNVHLTLIFDDVNRALPELVVPCGVDAWFLDGFAPAKNPAMWTDTLFDNMARLSCHNASMASFTAAGHVRRGLAARGFDVFKERGYGRKRDMITGHFTGAGVAGAKQENTKRSVAIVGGGLAGTAAAYKVRQRGHDAVLFERADDLAPGASGNERGLYNPRFTAMRGAISDFYNAAYGAACHLLTDQTHPALCHRACGALHFANTPEKDKRFRRLVEEGDWHDSHLRYLDAAQASDVAGLAVEHDALYLPESGCVSPRDLCRFYAAGIKTIYGTPQFPVSRKGGGWSVGGMDFDDVILACGADIRAFAPLEMLPVHTVRGQVTKLAANEFLAGLKTNLCYGGYVSVAQDGYHMLGSSFQKWLDDPTLRDEDDHDNLAKLVAALPSCGGAAHQAVFAGSRASFRTVSRDHFPIIGLACGGEGQDFPGLYLSTAHGSHGILSSLAGAGQITDMISGDPWRLPQNVVDHLHPGRWRA